ncbi:hypothetical protein [Pseudonocardia spinosispora]|uniref:hypothetical protein n=1 Tax=Pseudonocardia spinosispora TaxID=103441 RepID=UPI0012EBE6BE|nr:hypothetical protein [Pseudonocardia spinosispora]
MGTAAIVAFLMLAGMFLADFAAIVVIAHLLLPSTPGAAGRGPRLGWAQALLATMFLAKNLLNDPVKVWMRTPGEFNADPIAAAFVWSRPAHEAIVDTAMLIADATVLSWGIGVPVVLLFAARRDRVPGAPVRLGGDAAPAVLAAVVTIPVHDMLSDDSLAMSVVLVVLGIAAFALVCRSEYRTWTRGERPARRATRLRSAGQILGGAVVMWAILQVGPIITLTEARAQWADQAGSIVPMVLMMVLAAVLDMGRGAGFDVLRQRPR